MSRNFRRGPQQPTDPPNSIGNGWEPVSPGGCFACDRKTIRVVENPFQWSQSRTLCKKHSCIIKDNELLSTVMLRAKPDDYPLDGSLLPRLQVLQAGQEQSELLKGEMGAEFVASLHKLARQRFLNVFQI